MLLVSFVTWNVCLKHLCVPEPEHACCPPSILRGQVARLLRNARMLFDTHGCGQRWNQPESRYRR